MLGVKSFNLNTVSDKRGTFTRIFDDKNFLEDEYHKILQTNISRNPIRGTLRGMHYQLKGPPENKFIYVISGSLHMVISNAHLVESAEFVQNISFELNEKSEKVIYVPSGLATGWVSLSDNCVISYSMTSRFEECEYSGFRFNDPKASIKWPLIPNIISDKDLTWQNLK